MARGSLSTVRQGIQRARSDLSAKEYRNIDSKYRNQLLELKTAEMAASDLNEYHKVQYTAPAHLPYTEQQRPRRRASQLTSRAV